MKPAAVAVLAVVLCASVPQEKRGRYEGYTDRAAQGPKMKLVAATYFGGEGLEEFIAARILPDGTILAFGNAWGPEFPGAPLVLGKGEHRKLIATATDSK